MRSAFEFVAANFLTSRTEPLKGHPIAQFLRQEAMPAEDRTMASQRALLEPNSPTAAGTAAAEETLMLLNPSQGQPGLLTTTGFGNA